VSAACHIRRGGQTSGLMLRGVPGLMALVIAACSAGTTGLSTTSPEPNPTTTPTSTAETPWPAPSATLPDDASPSAFPSGEQVGDPVGPPDLSVGDWVVSTVEGLRLREEPGLDGASIGLLRIGYEGTVINGPVVLDGYEWVHLAWPGLPAGGGCATGPGAGGYLSFCGASGWVATADQAGNDWLAPARPECPPPPTTLEALSSIQPVVRVWCFGGQELTFSGFIAPETQGRGCYPGYDHDPAWLGPCAVSFLQGEESQYDATTYELAVHLHPDLGACDFGGAGVTCPIASHVGTWVVVTGQVDHPSAVSCRLEPWTGNEHAPDEASAVYACRERFVVTSVGAGAVPP